MESGNGKNVRWMRPLKRSRPPFYISSKSSETHTMEALDIVSSKVTDIAYSNLRLNWSCSMCVAKTEEKQINLAQSGSRRILIGVVARELGPQGQSDGSWLHSLTACVFAATCADELAMHHSVDGAWNRRSAVEVHASSRQTSITSTMLALVANRSVPQPQ
jgi:hypothetical protein